MPRIEAVLFDYGLVLTGPPHAPAWTRMQKLTGLGPPEFEAAYWAPRHGYDRGTHTGAAYWRAVGSEARLALSDAQVEALLEADAELWTQPNAAMIDWAARLQSAGTRTGILSNLGDHLTAAVLARLPWMQRFDHHTFSHALKLTKPDPAIYAHAAQGLDVPAPAILFVDDRAENIAGALAAGMQAIRYTDDDSFAAELEARSLGELWRSGRMPG